MSKSVLVVIDVQRGQELLRRLSAVHKLIIRDGLRIEDAVAAWGRSKLDQRHHLEKTVLFLFFCTR